MGFTIQLGLDLATPFTILAAAISFLVSQKKERKLSRNQFAVENLKGFLTTLRASSNEYDEICNELRTSQTEEELSAFFHKATFFLERIERELTAQIEIYFPIYIKGEEPQKGLEQYQVKISKHLTGLREAGTLEEKVEASKDIELLILEIEKAFANSLASILECNNI